MRDVRGGGRAARAGGAATVLFAAVPAVIAKYRGTDDARGPGRAGAPVSASDRPVTAIRAIETRYAGCRFRSRTEARWAVFFDALGIAWEYEREGYELPSGRYLPDFWLPRLGFWIEIKGRAPTEHEEAFAHDLSGHTKAAVYILWGVPGGDMEDGGVYWQCNPVTGAEYPCEDYWDNYQQWVACDWCDAAALVYMAKEDRILHSPGCTPRMAHGYRPSPGRLERAIEAARSARFGT